jgi:hypothetical protein
MKIYASAVSSPLKNRPPAAINFFGRGLNPSVANENDAIGVNNYIWIMGNKDNSNTV